MAVYILCVADTADKEILFKYEAGSIITALKAKRKPKLSKSEIGNFFWREVTDMTLDEVNALADPDKGGLPEYKVNDMGKLQWTRAEIEAAPRTAATKRGDAAKVRKLEALDGRRQ